MSSSHLTPALHYRPDIDGLRALAVLSVISFHAFPEMAHGGFIGVDIFFVISGFLISSIIFQGLAQQNFSVVEFYARRIRRIFPALIIVLLASFIVGWWLLTANEYKALGKYAVGGAGFVANLFFLHDGGYFGGAATAKPLLHLWSLGVEEQFYIVWPILLLLAYRLRLNRWLLLLAFASVSFVWGMLPLLASSMGWENHFDMALLKLLMRTDILAVFYLPQARFWELLIGAALAHWQLDRTCTTRSNSLAWAGVALLVLGWVLIKEDVVFPSYWALFPTLGTAFILAAGSQSWFNRTVLASRPFVLIGLISYPLYLWHWPLLSFAHIILGETPPIALRIGCIAVAFVLAWLTYRYIERPIRTSGYLRKKAVFLALVMALTGGFGLSVYLKDGLDSRAFAKRTQFISAASSDWKFPGDLINASLRGITPMDGAQLYTNLEKPPQILFLGDSHMQQYAPRLARHATEKNIPVLFLTGGGCPAIPDVISKDHYHCRALIEQFQAILKQAPSIETVVIGGCWNGVFLAESYAIPIGKRDVMLQTKEGKEAALARFGHFVATLTQNYRVYVLLDNPSADAFDPTTMLKNRLTFRGAESLPKSTPVIAAQVALNNELRQLVGSTDATVIEPLAHLCDRNNCKLFDRTGALIYQNATHLTAHFVTTEADYIDVVFSNLTGSP